MVVVRLPSLVAEQAGGQREFEIEGSTLGEALQALPIADLLLDERGELRRLVNVYSTARMLAWPTVSRRRSPACMRSG
ncbi:MAG: hypothetical protein ACRDNH_03665 [Gaiellaceae bacterium]